MSITYKQLSLDSVWNLSWNQAKKHFIVIFAMNVLLWLCSQISTFFVNTTSLVMTLKDPSIYTDPEQAMEVVMPLLLAIAPMLMLGGFISWLVSSYFQISLYQLLVDGVKGMTPNLGERIKGAYKGYLNYIISVFVSNLLVSLATCLCLLPGLFVQVRLLLVPIIAANKPEATLGEAIKESWNLTRGHFWTLLGYGIVAALVNVVGFICCCVGIVFTQVITQFMLANVYCMLSQEDEPEYQEEQSYEGEYNQEEK